MRYKPDKIDRRWRDAAMVPVLAFFFFYVMITASVLGIINTNIAKCCIIANDAIAHAEWGKTDARVWASGV